MISNKLDTSDELLVYRFGNGIRLINPDQRNKVTSAAYYTNNNIASLLNFPCSIYLENTQGVLHKLNEHNAEFCEFYSTKNALGEV